MTTIETKAPMERGEPPSPPEDWWFGHLLEMRKSPMKFLAATARDYGGIVKLRFRKNIVYLVSEPDLVKDLLIDHGSKYRKNTRYKFLQRVLGQGLLLSEGEAWRKQRKTAQPFFTPKGIAGRSPDVARIAEEVVESWRDHAASAEPMDVEHAFSRLAQRQALQFIVGPMHEERADAMATQVEISVKSWPVRVRGRFGGVRPPAVGRLLRLKKSIEKIDSLVYDFIDTYRSAPTDEAGLLPALVAAQDKVEPLEMRNKQLRDQIVTLFLAAFETSASGLCWTMYLLDQHRDVRQRVYDEIDRELEGRTLTAAELPKLKYLDRVISESLRLYSPIHSLSRVALEDDTIGGFAIAKGSTMMVSLYATHRLPTHWPEPERFDTDRFLPQRSAGRHRCAYIPFAIGHRNCMGSVQAVVNAKINIATIAQRYMLKLAPGQKIEPEARTTMRPRFGMKMIVEER